VVGVSWSDVVLCLMAGLAISVVTSPVGVSGAVFLLPVQLDVLQVPSPAVTPTNLLFNVIAVPGALLRYHRAGRLGGSLTAQMLAGTVPGVVLGAVIRVFAVPGPHVFRAIVAALLMPLGLWLCTRALKRAGTAPPAEPRPRSVVFLSLGVGVVGGIYGIGGGSLLGPILAGQGVAVTLVAPAALTSTFVTSLVGALTYALLSLTAPGAIAPDWATGILCGIGGLVGGYLGTLLQPRLPESALRFGLGFLAVALATTYAIQVAG